MLKMLPTCHLSAQIHYLPNSFQVLSFSRGFLKGSPFSNYTLPRGSVSLKKMGVTNFLKLSSQHLRSQQLPSPSNRQPLQHLVLCNHAYLNTSTN